MKNTSATRAFRNYTLWSLDIMSASWVLLLTAMAEDYLSWTFTAWVFFPSLILECVFCSIFARVLYPKNEKALPQPLPSWLRQGCVFSTATAFVSAIFLVPIAESPEASFVLSAPLSVVAVIALCVVAALPSTRTFMTLYFTGTILTICGLALSFVWHRVFSNDGYDVAFLLGLTMGLLVGVCLFPLLMRWTFSLMNSIGTKVRLSAMQAELAVADERLRIARDLHDVFGRTLTAVAVKTELAAALADAEGAPRAADEARRVHQLADDALKEVRAVLAEYRRPDFSVEVLGALSLLSSAGIPTTFSGERDVPAEASEPLALVLREAATNVVRHSDATTCTITVRYDDEGAELVVVNNRAREGDGKGSGLDGLAERLSSFDGHIGVHRERDEFVLTAWVPLDQLHDTDVKG